MYLSLMTKVSTTVLLFSLQMYYSEKGPYKRGAGGQAITFENSAVVVHGVMEPNTYHPVLNISVIPQVRML